MNKTLYFLFFIFSYIFCYQISADSIEEKYESGKTSKRYYTDSENKKSGSYFEFYENGNYKVKANYIKDMLDGLYTEFAENGKKTLEIQYSKGLKHGLYRVIENNLIKKEEFWINGTLAFPKSINEIKIALLKITKLKTEFIGEWPKDFQTDRFTKEVEADNIAGIQKLREYRYLCDLDYEDIAANRLYIAHNLDAVILLNKINQLDHTPANPGLPEDVYKSAYKGTSSSNLAMSSRGSSAVYSINMFMDDSDPSNISRVGHRRWCLNPAMAATGFGTQGGFTSMWSFDNTRKAPTDYDFVCYPPKGYTPSTHFRKSYAWNVSLNLKKYEKPDKEKIKVTVIELQNGDQKTPRPKSTKPAELALTFFNVDLSGIGDQNSIIFLPENISVVAKSRYFVSITGLKLKGDKDAKIEYYVEFF